MKFTQFFNRALACAVIFLPMSSYAMVKRIPQKINVQKIKKAALPLRTYQPFLKKSPTKNYYPELERFKQLKTTFDEPSLDEIIVRSRKAQKAVEKLDSKTAQETEKYQLEDFREQYLKETGNTIESELAKARKSNETIETLEKKAKKDLQDPQKEQKTEYQEQYSKKEQKKEESKQSNSNKKKAWSKANVKELIWHNIFYYAGKFILVKVFNKSLEITMGLNALRLTAALEAKDLGRFLDILDHELARAKLYKIAENKNPLNLLEFLILAQAQVDELIAIEAAKNAAQYFTPNELETILNTPKISKNMYREILLIKQQKEEKPEIGWGQWFRSWVPQTWSSW